MAEQKPQKAKPSTKQKVSNLFRSPLFKVLLSIFLFFFIGASAFVLYYYNTYSRVIDRKLSGDQGPRGWGLFLIRHMVDGMEVTTEGEHRTVRLTIRTPVPGD